MALTRNVVRSGVTRDVTWDLSNGEFYGGVTPTLHYDFVTDKSLVARVGPTLSITRATSATYRDNTGTIQTASSGTARFDHDKDGNSLGLLVEEARTNLCLRSADASLWTSNLNLTIGADAVVAPDGTLTGDSCTVTTVSGQHRIYNTITASAVSEHTFSTHLKYSDHRFVLMRTYDTAFRAQVFDLLNGTVGSDSGNIVSSSITDVGGGWYRCAMTVLPVTTGVTQLYIGGQNTDNASAESFAGSDTVYYQWGAQFEAGSFPTSYIPTTTASVTRNADQVSTTDVAWQSEEFGSYYVGATVAHDPSIGNDRLFEINDGGASDRFYLNIDASGNVEWASATLTGTDATMQGTSGPTESVSFQIAAAYASDDLMQYLDGVQNGTAISSVTVPHATAHTTLFIGRDSTSVYFQGNRNSHTLAQSAIGVLPASDSKPNLDLPPVLDVDNGPVTLNKDAKVSVYVNRT